MDLRVGFYHKEGESGRSVYNDVRAFSRKRFWRKEKVEGLKKMTFIVATSVWGRGKACMLEQAQDKIMNNGENLTRIAQGHAGSIFVKGDVAAVV